MQTFSFHHPINLVEEGKWIIALTSCEATNTVFNITDENNGFSIPIPGCWYFRGGEETMKGLRQLLGLEAETDIELHVQEVKNRGNHIKIGDKETKLSDLDTRKST